MNSFVEEVDWLKKIDLTQGFSSWHIKWPIGILGSEFPESIYSKNFDTSMSNKNGKLKFIWCLKLEKPKVSLDKFTLEIHPCTLSVPTPVIFRFALSYEGEDPIFTSSFYILILSSDQYCFEEMDGLVLKRDVNLTVHCWMDIPNDVLKFIETRREKCLKEDEELTVESFRNSSNIEGFLANSEAMYKGAIGEDKSFASLSDVTLVVERPKLSACRFYCHRNILAARSPVFFSMFTTSQWKEGEDRIVEIDDIDENIMKFVLYHIYTGQFAVVDDTDLPALIYAADKYQLQHLKASSVAQLITSGDFKDENRIDQLLLAERHQIHQLKAACIALMSTNVNVFKNIAHLALSTELFVELLEAFSKRQVETKLIETTTDPNN